MTAPVLSEQFERVTHLAKQVTGRFSFQDAAHQYIVHSDDAALNRQMRLYFDHSEPVAIENRRILHVYDVQWEQPLDEWLVELESMPVLRAHRHYKGGKHYREIHLGHVKAFLPDFSRHHVVLRDEEHIFCVSHGESLNQAFRVAREVYFREQENQGAILLHAAAVGGTGGGLLIAGPSGSGKTTLLSMLMQCCGLPYLANDRVFLHPGPPPQLRTFPGPVRIGFGTLSQFPPEWQHLNLYREQFMDLKSVNVQAKDFHRQYSRSQKVEFLPLELAKVLGTGVALEAPLKAIVIPRFSLESTDRAWKPLSADEGWDVLKPEVQTPFDESWLEPWVWPHMHPTEWYVSHVEKSMKSLLRNFPVFELTFGPTSINNTAFQQEVKMLLLNK